MRLAALAVLAAAFAACGNPPEKTPTPDAVGAELATFPQLLVPISSQTWASMQMATKRNDVNFINANQYPQPYAHGSVLVADRDTPVILAYTSVWLAPAPAPLQPMSVQQYLRIFGAVTEINLAVVIAPKGNIFFTREQLPDIMGAVRKAGAGSEDLPYSVVHGAGR
ncbi:MAG: hypothetical protein AAB268_02110 [Elusimicrobiota bacterium]